MARHAATCGRPAPSTPGRKAPARQAPARRPAPARQAAAVPDCDAWPDKRSRRRQDPPLRESTPSRSRTSTGGRRARNTANPSGDRSDS
eukprot:4465238-Alexandrium_andersonii.AAC.1